MKKFEFSSKRVEPVQIFSGAVFYNTYKDAQFLQHDENIETILAKGYQLRRMMKESQPGQVVAVDGMFLKENIPLMVKKTGPNVIVENYEFTANRLNGFVAAYAFKNRLKYTNLISSEALALGLTWENNNEDKCRLFLSCVSGTEHFYDQFRYYPLLCALRKLQLEKITLEPVTKIAKIKNPQGERMAKDFMRNLANIKKVCQYFPGVNGDTIRQLLLSAPPELKKLFET